MQSNVPHFSSKLDYHSVNSYIDMSLQYLKPYVRCLWHTNSIFCIAIAFSITILEKWYRIKCINFSILKTTAFNVPWTIRTFYIYQIIRQFTLILETQNYSLVRWNIRTIPLSISAWSERPMHMMERLADGMTTIAISFALPPSASEKHKAIIKRLYECYMCLLYYIQL